MKRGLPSDDGEDGDGRNADLHQEGPPRKRRGITLAPPTTVHHLPIEVLQQVIVYAVTAEVSELKLSKSAWRRKVDEILQRLAEVSQMWNEVTSTAYIHGVIHALLDHTTEKRIRLEIVQQSPFALHIMNMTTMRNNIFLLYTPNGHDFMILVYHLRNFNHIIHIIPLDSMSSPCGIAACGVSNVIYILDQMDNQHSRSHHTVVRVTRKNKSDVFDPWVSDLSLSDPKISVTINSHLLVHSSARAYEGHVVHMYDVSGLLIRKIFFDALNLAFHELQVVNESKRGNLILALQVGRQRAIKIVELELESKSIVNHYTSCINAEAEVYVVDDHDRLMVSNRNMKTEVLDKELNVIESVDPVPHLQPSLQFPDQVQYNREQNLVVRVPCNRRELATSRLTIYRLVEY